MTFNRHIESNLTAWKTQANRKPLILRGARQVGKSTVVKKFALSYKHQIILNLEKEEDASFFIQVGNVHTMVESLFLRNNIPFSEIGETLLFIDEIQESPEAIRQLRYFYEEIPRLHVIAAGSLLEFAMRKVKSFPVGRVEYLYMYPLNFLEFLEATGFQQALDQLKTIPVKPLAQRVLYDQFNKYAIIGGMPEVINYYIETGSITELPRFYESIWSTYLDDVEKYASNETERRVIKHVMETAPLCIDQRIKFQNFGNSNYRSREVGEALRHLDNAKIIQLMYPTLDLEVPLKPSLNKSPKLQMLDTGLLNYILHIQAEMLTYKDLSNAYKGAIIPHLITQEIISTSTSVAQKPFFWIREKKQASSEVDLVLQYKKYIIPIEIKSGKTGTLRSLHQFIEAVDHNYAVRIYGGEFLIEKTTTPNGKSYILMNLPYFLGTQLNKYIEYFVENYK